MNQESVIKDQWYGYNKKLAQVAGEGVTLHVYVWDIPHVVGG